MGQSRVAWFSLIRIPANADGTHDRASCTPLMTRSSPHTPIRSTLTPVGGRAVKRWEGVLRGLTLPAPSHRPSLPFRPRALFRAQKCARKCSDGPRTPSHLGVLAPTASTCPRLAVCAPREARLVVQRSGRGLAAAIRGTRRVWGRRRCVSAGSEAAPATEDNMDHERQGRSTRRRPHTLRVPWHDRPASTSESADSVNLPGVRGCVRRGPTMPGGFRRRRARDEQRVRVDGNGLRRAVVGEAGIEDEELARRHARLDEHAQALERQRRAGFSTSLERGPTSAARSSSRTRSRARSPMWWCWRAAISRSASERSRRR